MAQWLLKNVCCCVILAVRDLNYVASAIGVPVNCTGMPCCIVSSADTYQLGAAGVTDVLSVFTSTLYATIDTYRDFFY